MADTSIEATVSTTCFQHPLLPLLRLRRLSFIHSGTLSRSEIEGNLCSQKLNLLTVMGAYAVTRQMIYILYTYIVARKNARQLFVFQNLFSIVLRSCISIRHWFQLPNKRHD